MDSISSNGDHQLIKRQKVGNTGTARDSIVTYLPDHLMHEILLRSPAESLLRFKIVCKNWCSLIKDRNFINQYLDHHKGNNDSMGMVLMTPTTDHPNPEGFDLANFNKLCGDHEDILQAEEFELTLNMDDYPMRLSTCNGFVCFYRESPVLLWNPVSKEFIMLSELEFEEEVEFLIACGFGYDAVKNEYKVVQLLTRLSDSSLECMVLNLGINMSWRRIPDQDNMFYPNIKNHEDGSESIFSEGTIYWWAYTDDILCFDVSAETFKVIQAPAPVQRSTRPHHLQHRPTTWLVELDKSLCFAELDVRSELIYIWMMQKDYPDMKTAWVMVYGIDLEAISNMDFDIRPVCIRGMKIYFNCKNGLACYDKWFTTKFLIFIILVYPTQRAFFP